MDPRQKWRWIKRARSDYKPRPVSIRDSQGKPTSQTPQAALKQLAHNKAPGPDTLPAEAWQWLDQHNQQALLRVLNQSLLTATIPDDWHAAILVEIYKGKGPLTDPASYRPMSLLNLLSTLYKLFAKIIHNRLQAAIDDRLRDTQFGFRATRSTAQRIHIIRRLIERAEATGQSLYTILDWEKACDKIHPRGPAHGARHIRRTTLHSTHQKHLHLPTIHSSSSSSSSSSRAQQQPRGSALWHQAGMPTFPIPDLVVWDDHARRGRSPDSKRRISPVAAQPEPTIL